MQCMPERSGAQRATLAMSTGGLMQHACRVLQCMPEPHGAQRAPLVVSTGGSMKHACCLPSWDSTPDEARITSALVTRSSYS